MSKGVHPEIIGAAVDIGASLIRRLIDMASRDEDWEPIINLLPDTERARHQQALARAHAQARLAEIESSR